ncbi:phage terminase small subunit [Jeotgalibacillus proteolyticus]|uniref:PBSX phage terminase small subunit-like N-terminal domain-containing protein n=1 Tax=Jeotgalibacillus proteolyticus TaxID=2082395 RepID=A0A2S5GAN5_9BACL|nr:phage terminase small subunit [Jeotgalibacillus proteolyticus]PPA70050.1 hypothetical protein C4B60_10670 [Jeotgalibacillus proteolyticus]
MPRARDPNRDKAFEIWKEKNGDITNRALAEMLNVPEKTISAWKSRDKWNAVLQTNDRSTTMRKKKPERKKRSGNPNPSNQFTKRNSTARTHGFFSKFLPEETLEIMEAMNEFSAADLIWDQIQIQYAAIIRAQKIMFVTGKDELIKELKKTKTTSTDFADTKEEEWEFQFAWDRHASFLNAQSRAMSELRGLIKQFNELAYEHDERRLKLEQMQTSIDKNRAVISKLDSDGEGSQESEVAKMLRRMAGVKDE